MSWSAAGIWIKWQGSAGRVLYEFGVVQRFSRNARLNFSGPFVTSSDTGMLTFEVRR